MLWVLILMLPWDESICVQAGGVNTQPTAQFSYDAVDSKDRRKAPAVSTRSEDRILDTGKRAILQANARDIQRNFAIAGWMIRRHLDYVADFGFHSRTEDPGLNSEIEAMWTEWSRPYNCDAAGRHRFGKLIRLAEARRTVDGDVGLLKIADGTLQGIEGDRIRNPRGIDANPLDWTLGVKTDSAGRARAYAIHRRTIWGGFEFERMVSAVNLCMHGYFDRYDQVRGISPLAAGLNSLRDVYENFDYALAKAKLSQLFALVITRAALDSAGDVDDQSEAGDGSQKSKIKVDFGNGPVVFDFDPGEDAKFLESQQPSTQFQNFTMSVVMVALKALDIPYSFYDESHTNFFGSRGAWLHYERSCRDKRGDVLELLERITIWRLAMWVAKGDLVLPRSMTFRELAWEWVPAGMPWWDPTKEINGELAAISAGLDNPQRICKERGRGDFYDNVDQIAKASAYARDKGVTLKFDPHVDPITVVPADQVANGK